MIVVSVDIAIGRKRTDTASHTASRALEDQPGLLLEFLAFLRYNKKWWLTPIVVVLLMVALLIVLFAISIATIVLVSLQSTALRQATHGREALARVRAHWAARAGIEGSPERDAGSRER